MRKTIIKIVCFAACTLLFSGVIATPSYAQVAVGVSINFAPPDLPVYDQPPCPGEDYIWTPGYWAWDDDYGDYYWVPGTWVLAPEPGYFWTPGYWAWGGSGFAFTAGYWGPVVGFYGGINYGFGYFGRGYEGGRWDRGHFFYNREVNNVNVNIIHNTYNTTVVNRTVNVTRVSYNGGNGGVNVRATAQEEAAARERHIPPVAAQTQHIQQARANPELRANSNHGKPPIAATDRPATFKGNVVAAREGGAVHNEGARPANRLANQPTGNVNRPPENNNANRPNYSHVRDIPAPQRPAPPNTGNQKLDQKYQQQQEKLATQQAKEQQKLQQKQEQDHQKLEKQRADDSRKQQVEQRHQQQTQQLVQRHQQQTQQMQQRQQPRPAPPAERPPKHP
ncbi:MAG TPA: YXWGXW repeat-containing protein [Candidatus Dormibacteraeota bacterium]|jgi:hypothetical protein|nr:YXWGXW repeat-containing protein [Candidatus Dormibacteraeota bacterium]